MAPRFDSSGVAGVIHAVPVGVGWSWSVGFRGRGLPRPGSAGVGPGSWSRSAVSGVLYAVPVCSGVKCRPWSVSSILAQSRTVSRSITGWVTPGFRSFRVLYRPNRSRNRAATSQDTRTGTPRPGRAPRTRQDPRDSWPRGSWSDRNRPRLPGAPRNTPRDPTINRGRDPVRHP